ncbi:GNAT family N-acetyltransferase [uncultured Clostridium sp.]|uniref:GNAT family N-acetyltransferase n=1 Tax=uncultured Clostridium sp. TaxID=59620 RepID=UPI0025EAC76A|nr:GNAT family N-acetyltransferase [uncultured Clostridium sp.]
MKRAILKDNKELVIREIVKEDSKAIVEYCNKVAGDSDFLSFGENEFGISIEEEEKIIENIISCDNETIIVGTIDNVIVAVNMVRSTKRKRTHHVSTVSISVMKKYWNLGIGHFLMNEVIEWATNNGVTKKLSVIVRDDNEKAIDLYKKCGFVMEGVLIRDVLVKEKYYNSILMGKLI